MIRPAVIRSMTRGTALVVTLALAGIPDGWCGTATAASSTAAASLASATAPGNAASPPPSGASRSPDLATRLQLEQAFEQLSEPSTEVWRAIASRLPAASDLCLLARGVLALDGQRLEEARHAFEAARAARGGAPYAHYYLARLELAAGRPGAALPLVRAAVLRKRDFAAAYRLLGHVYLELGEPLQGLTALRTVIALAPGRAAPHLELGRAYLGDGQPERAVIELQRAHELEPELLVSLFLLGKARLNAGHLEAGFDDLEAYVQAATGVPGEEERLARARLLLERFAGA